MRQDERPRSYSSRQMIAYVHACGSRFLMPGHFFLSSNAGVVTDLSPGLAVSKSGSIVSTVSKLQCPRACRQSIFSRSEGPSSSIGARNPNILAGPGLGSLLIVSTKGALLTSLLFGVRIKYR